MMRSRSRLLPVVERNAHRGNNGEDVRRVVRDSQGREMRFQLIKIKQKMNDRQDRKMEMKNIEEKMRKGGDEEDPEKDELVGQIVVEPDLSIAQRNLLHVIGGAAELVNVISIEKTEEQKAEYRIRKYKLHETEIIPNFLSAVGDRTAYITMDAPHPRTFPVYEFNFIDGL